MAALVQFEVNPTLSPPSPTICRPSDQPPISDWLLGVDTPQVMSGSSSPSLRETSRTLNVLYSLPCGAGTVRRGNVLMLEKGSELGQKRSSVFTRTCAPHVVLERCDTSLRRHAVQMRPQRETALWSGALWEKPWLSLAANNCTVVCNKSPDNLDYTTVVII